MIKTGKKYFLSEYHQKQKEHKELSTFMEQLELEYGVQMFLPISNDHFLAIYHEGWAGRCIITNGHLKTFVLSKFQLLGVHHAGHVGVHLD